MARLAGLGDIRIIFEEIMPNILPLAAASFVGATSGAILAGIGLEVLGMGPQRTPTLGMTILGAALLGLDQRVMVVVAAAHHRPDHFVRWALLTSAALDEFVNPRLRKSG